MHHALLAILALGLPLAAQSQIARFDFENSQLHSVQPAFAFVSDLSLSNAYAFGGSPADRALALPSVWNAIGGRLWFCVTPSYGQRLSFQHLKMAVAAGPGSPTTVNSFVVYANGTLIGGVNPIPHNTVLDVDLTGFLATQNQVLPVWFVVDFVGNPGGQSPLEISQILLTGDACDFDVSGVAPASLLTVTSQSFLVTGTGFTDAQGAPLVTQVKFGGVPLSPLVPGDFGPGAYEVEQWAALRVHPPQLLPPGPYTIEVTAGCGTKYVQVTLVDPTQPTLACEGKHPAGQTQCFSLHAGGPGPQILIIALSPSNLPSVVPGLLSLGLGDNFTNYAAVFFVGDSVQWCVPVPVAKLGICHYYQGIVWHSSNLDLTSPLPTTTLATTCWF